MNILVFFAHPDDETIFAGGLLAKYAAEGIETGLICATRGEVGEVAPHLLENYLSIGDLRADELRCAAGKLGLDGVHFLGYRDSGMSGSQDNQHPRALATAPVDEVGPGPVRFMMLYRKNDAPLEFDFVKVTEQSRDNPVFYVQYAHARAHSVFRNTADAFADFDPENPVQEIVDLSLLSDTAETGLIKRIAQYPRILEAAAASHEPHRIAFYLYELAGDFHGLWNRGKESPQLRFINEDNRDLTMARVALVAAIAEVLASGLGILGVQAIREMR